MRALRAYRAAGRVLERHGDVDMLVAGPQPDRAGYYRCTDRGQQPDDDPGRQRIYGRWA